MADASNAVAQVADEIAKMKSFARGSGKLEVLTRQGSTTDLENVDRVAAGTAKKLIVVPDAESSSASHSHVQQSTCLALTLQQNVQKAPDRRANAVVAMPPGHKTSFDQATSLSPNREVRV